VVTVAELLAVIDGETVPLTKAVWISFAACGCPFGALTAAFGDEAFATEEQALRHIYPTKRERDRHARRGDRLELMSWDRYRAEIDLSVRCPHVKGATTQATLDAALGGTS
jgi:hypothetical protein